MAWTDSSPTSRIFTQAILNPLLESTQGTTNKPLPTSYSTTGGILTDTIDHRRRQLAHWWPQPGVENVHDSYGRFSNHGVRYRVRRRGPREHGHGHDRCRVRVLRLRQHDHRRDRRRPGTML